MPIVPHSDLPAFERLRAEGVEVHAAHAGLTHLHVGLLNLMPSAAMAATDRQFIRLLSGSTDRANIHVHAFTLGVASRAAEGQAYAREYYADFSDLRSRGLDALIVTGANPTHFELADEPYWDGLVEVLDWVEDSVHSTLCSCLATHAILEHRGLAKRSELPEKRWGVYEHATVDLGHPLLEGLEAPIEAPHSHYFDVTRRQLEDVGARVLVFSDDAGVHMASSSDGFRYVFFQGHPEYDDISLLKEYRREVFRHLEGEREGYPPFPVNYFDDRAQAILVDFRERAGSAKARGAEPPEFPEAEVLRRWRPTWFDQGRRMVNNWLTELTRRVET